MNSICPKNEQSAYKIRSHIETFTNGKVKLEITWKTRKIKSLFPLKDRVTHKSNFIYEGKCNAVYIGETKRNAQVCWREHDQMAGKSEPSKHVLNNIGHAFEWKVITNAPGNFRKRKILDAFYIVKQKPSINDQLDIRFLRLFRNGIT